MVALLVLLINSAFAVNPDAPYANEIRNPSLRHYYVSHMTGGKVNPDILGTKLPSFLTCDRIYKFLLAKKNDTCGAKEDPNNAGKWIIWSTRNNAEFNFGLIEVKDEKPHLRSRMKDKMVSKLYQLDHFDFGNYDLGPLGMAVGVHLMRPGCGSSHNLCVNGKLILYVPKKRELRQVYSSMMDYLSVRVGLQAHNIEEQTATLNVMFAQKGTIPTLEKSIPRSTVTQTFVWDKAKHSFEPKTGDIIKNIDVY